MRKRHRFQFRLRSLLLAITCTAVLLSALPTQRALREARAVAALRQRGAMITLEPAAPAWLRSLLGDRYLRATELEFHRPHGKGEVPVNDDDLIHLGALSELRHVSLGLRYIMTIDGWQPPDSQITDEGLESLASLDELVQLYLDAPQVTDAGLEHLQSLTRLRLLILHNTQVTDVGVRKLRESLPNLVISRSSD